MKPPMTSAQEFVRRLDLLDVDSPMDDNEALEILHEFGLDPVQLVKDGRTVVDRLDRVRDVIRPAAPRHLTTTNIGHSNARPAAPSRGPPMRAWRLMLVTAVLGVLAFVGWLARDSMSAKDGGVAAKPPDSSGSNSSPSARFNPEEWRVPSRSADELASPGGTPPLKNPATAADGHLVVQVQAGGAPRPDAKIRLYLRGPRDPQTSGSQWRFAGGGTTDAEGRLQIAARPGSYLIAARAGGFAITRREVVRPSAENVTQVQIPLEAGHVLRGKAIEKNSRAEIPLTQLALTRFSYPRSGRNDSPAEETVFVAADSRGHFEIPGLEPGNYSIEATAPGRGKLNLHVLVPRTSELTLEIAAAGTLEGRVLDAEGAPAVAATVVVRGGEELASATTGPEGAFAVEVSAGHYTLSARLGNRIGALETPVVIAPGTSRRGLIIRLGSGGGIEGIVRSRATQKPIADAVVALTPFAGEGDLGQAATTADGKFAIQPLAAGVYDVEVYSEGYSPLVRRGVTLSPAQRFPLVLELEGTGSAAGTIRDGAGAPVSGAVVQGGEVWGGPFIWGSSGQVRSGPDGAFRLTGLEAGRVRINAGRSPDFFLTHNFATVRAGEETRLDFKLEESGALAGRVTRRGGLPLNAEAIVRAVPQGFATIEDIRTAPIDAGGRYRLVLPAGRYMVGAFRVDEFPRMTSNAATLIPPSGTVEKDLELSDDPGPLLVSGTVIEADGIPSPNAYVVVRDPRADGKSGPPWLANVRSDERGRFEVRRRGDSSPALLDVTSRNGGRLGALQAVRAGTTEAVVRLEASGAVSGQVEGSRLSTVQVHVQVIDERAMPWLSGDPQEFAGDSFELREVPATEVRVTAFDTDGNSGSSNVTVTAGAPVRVTIKLQAAGSVHGRVVDEAGKPIKGVFARVDGRGGIGPSGADGAFEISGVPAGARHFSARASGYAPHEKDIAVQVGERLELGDVLLVRSP